jgi:hypothetical protein
MFSIYVEIPYDVYVHYGFSFMYLYFYCFKFTFSTDGFNSYNIWRRKHCLRELVSSQIILFRGIQACALCKILPDDGL